NKDPIAELRFRALEMEGGRNRSLICRLFELLFDLSELNIEGRLRRQPLAQCDRLIMGVHVKQPEKQQQVVALEPSHQNRTDEVGLDIWEKLDGEDKKTFNGQYIELASEYFISTWKAGFKDMALFINPMIHVVMSGQPKYRYLLVSVLDRFFFQLLLQ
ncbi:unnamed protein product, partial [Pleuronectes platessa]